MHHITGPEDFAAAFDVSRETIARLTAYAALLSRWNARINLVGRASLADLWHRHLADSAQLWRLRPPAARSWLDLGSGAGLPGIVLAILATDHCGHAFAVAESDLRKAAFLQAAARELALPVTVHPVRIEALTAPRADIVTARALAPLTTLMLYTEKCRRPGGTALFLKGRSVHKEVAAAQARWEFDHRLHPSLTDPDAAAVEIGAIHGSRG